MFQFIVSTGLMLIAMHLINKKFGLWAGIGIVLPHIMVNGADYLVAGNQTQFRQVVYSLWGFILILAYFKTLKKLKM